MRMIIYSMKSMFILSNMIFIVLSLACMFPSSQQRPPQNDQMCNINGAILSVKDELKTIAIIAKGVTHTSINIERHIKQTTAIDKLSRDIDEEINYTDRHLPTSFYHFDFFSHSNINKEYLTKLFSEAHNALIYYYNSIDDLLKLESVLSRETDEQLKNIQDNLRYEMICRYRNVLDVYSQRWKSFNEDDDDRIHFSKMSGVCPSCIHNVRSIVIVRNVRKWMKTIVDVVDDLEKKYG